MESLPQQDIARWVLAVETGDQVDLESLPEAAERACRKLSQQLARLVTAVGSQALLARALYLTRTEFPFLAGVRAGTTPECCLEGLHESLRGVDSTQVRNSLAALFARLIELLTTFVGEDLTLRLLGEAWPEASREQPGSERREA